MSDPARAFGVNFPHGKALRMIQRPPKKAATDTATDARM